MKKLTLPALALVIFLVTRPTPSFALVGPAVGDACTLIGQTLPASPNAGGDNLVCSAGLTWAAVTAAAAGSTGYVQFNSSGALAGDSGLFWDNTDKWLGIGTASPAQKLDINGNLNFSNTTSNTIFYGTHGVAAPAAASAGEKIQLYGTAGTVGVSDYALGIEGGNMWFNTGGGFKWYVSGAVKAVMNSSGDIGIGTTTPGYPLDVETSTLFGIYGTTSDTATGSTAIEGAETATIGTNYGVVGTSASTGQGAGVSGSETGASNTGDGVYGTNVSSLAYGGYFTNTATTGAGVGLVGAAGGTGAAKGVYGFVNGAGNTGYAVYGANTGGTGANFGVVGTTNSTGTGTGVYGSETGASNTGYALYATNSSATGWDLYAAGTAPSYFAGNVGIGTTSPAATLDVNGDIRSETGTAAVGGACTPNGATVAAAEASSGKNLVCTSGLWAAVTAAAAGSPGYVQFNSSNALAGDSNLFWDNTNKYLGIGTATPGSSLNIVSANPIIRTETTSGATDTKWFQMNTFANGASSDFTIDAVNDAQNSGIHALLIQRTGTTINYVSFPNSNVGIGNSSPAQALDVTGNIAIGGNTVLNVNNTSSLVVGTSGAVSETGAANTIFGYQAGNSDTTGTANTVAGYQAGYSQTTANSNTLNGYQAGYYITTGSGNAAIGNNAMQGTSGNGLTGNYNTAIGEYALLSIQTTATQNTAVGYAAGYSQTTATNNTLNGFGAGYYITTGSGNTAIGLQAMEGSSGNGLTGNYNTALGFDSLYALQTTATNNTATGYNAGYSQTTAANNTLNGSYAGYYISTGNDNTAVGLSAMQGVSGSGLTGNYNTALGFDSLYSLQTTAAQNTALGTKAGYSLTTATNNTLVGYNAGYYITTGAGNTAIGTNAMLGVSGSWLTGNYNTAVGMQALYSIATTDTQNVGLGYLAGEYISGASYNTAIGGYALQGISGTALSGSFNVALGYTAQRFITTGASNTALGYAAMTGVSGSELTGNANTAVGGLALNGITTTAAGNTAIGYQAGKAGTAITTGTYDTFVGYNAQSNNATYTNGTAIGNGAVLSASNEVVLGNSSVTQTLLNGEVGIGTTSPAAGLDVRTTGSTVGQIIHVASGTPWLYLYYNDTFSSSGAAGSAYIDNSGNFYTGNNQGTSYTIYTNGSGNPRLTITGSGNVGIGTTAPSYPLQVQSSSISLNLYSYSTYSSGTAIEGEANNSSGTGVYAREDNSGGTAFIGDNVGDGYYCYIGTSSYSIVCSGPTSGLSDERLKKDIRPLGADEGLAAIMKMQPVHYRWKDARMNTHADGEIGFIAQNVERVLPQLVSEVKQPPDAKIRLPGGEEKVLQYDRLAAPIVKAIQQQQGEIRDVKADNDNLEHKMEGMKADNDNLRALVTAKDSQQQKKIEGIKADNDNLRALVAAQGHEIEELKAQMAKIAH